MSNLDLEKLKLLLEKAQGNRTQNQFADNIGISSAMLTQVRTGIRRPSPDILYKIAKKAYNNVTYIELMQAAGYLDNEMLGLSSTPNQVTVIGKGGEQHTYSLEEDQIKVLQSVIDAFDKSRKK